MIVYLLFLCGFLNSAMAEIFPQEVHLPMMQTNNKNKRSNNFIPLVNFSVPLMIQKEGFHVETHIVKTEDGYLLSLHRIPGKNGSLPVLLLHGLLTSSADWVIPGKNNGLAFILANRGYDVWMGNFRGNTYSRAHVFLSPSDSKFWNFSFHEMGIYDLPAMILYITNMTSQPLHTYIGYSLGTTASYVMAVERPKIARRVRIMISLAPIASLKHMISPIRLLAPFAKNLQAILHLVGEDEFLPHDIVIYVLSKLLCDMTRIQEEICTNLIFLLLGFNRDQFDITLLPMILNYVPAGSSTKTIVHLAQQHNSWKFRQYDYGHARNLQIYNTPEPPEYNLANITMPFALFYAENDWLSTIPDVKRLINLLPNVVDKYKVPLRKFGHLDFIWAKNAPELVYNKVVEVMKNSRPN